MSGPFKVDCPQWKGEEEEILIRQEELYWERLRLTTTEYEQGDPGEDEVDK